MKQVIFVEMMGEPGSYDASVYDHFEDKDREGVWFVKRFGDAPGIRIDTRNICIGEALPDPEEVDGVVLAGSYNSVHDNTGWQKVMRAWLPRMRATRRPILGVCGAHQLLAQMCGARVGFVPDGPYAGTYALDLRGAARGSPLFHGLPEDASFQYANSEHVLDVPKGATLLATSGPITVAALDYGHHCYTTQFHPEGTHETLSCVWRLKAPDLMARYRPENFGNRLVRNFLRLVAESQS